MRLQLGGVFRSLLILSQSDCSLVSGDGVGDGDGDDDDGDGVGDGDGDGVEEDST